MALKTAVAGWFVVVTQAGCKDQLLAIVGTNNSNLIEWIDPDTPSTECIRKLCTNTNFAVCNPSAGTVLTEDLVS